MIHHRLPVKDVDLPEEESSEETSCTECGEYFRDCLCSEPVIIKSYRNGMSILSSKNPAACQWLSDNGFLGQDIETSRVPWVVGLLRKHDFGITYEGFEHA